MQKFDQRLSVLVTEDQRELLVRWATAEDRPVNYILRRLIDEEAIRRSGNETKDRIKQNLEAR